jgi:hypothetical protein
MPDSATEMESAAGLTLPPQAGNQFYISARSLAALVLLVFVLALVRSH